MAHAAHYLLADIAALVEGDAVQRIHGGIVRKGVAEDEIDAALGDGEPDAVAVPIGGGALVATPA